VCWRTLTGRRAGAAGKAYAKVLQDVAAGEAPVVTYWKQTLIIEDNRIAAAEADRSSYLFSRERIENGKITVTARLLFRRAFQEIQAKKEWQTPDILMEEVVVSIEAPEQRNLLLPLILGRY